VFVVASARDGFDPAEVLFEREGLRRDTPPSREKGKEPSATIAQCFDRQRSDEYGEANIASTMSARDYKDATDLVAQPIPLDTMNIIERPSDERRANRIGRGYGEAGDPMFTITKGHSHAVVQSMATSFYANEGSHGMGDNTEISVTLKAHGSSNLAAVQHQMAVRRLTPRECERLQGFPDDYTAIPGAADGPRYKALGNSMAVPVMAWIGTRINNATLKGE
jgi:DNA (cytosine-5)-methyltransferase 1